MAQVQDLSGLLTGISQAPIDPRVGLTPMQQLQARGMEANQGLRKAAGGLMSSITGKEVNVQTTRERAQTELAGLDVNDPKDQPRILEIYTRLDPNKAAQLKAAFAQQDRDRSTISAEGLAQENEREALADYLALEYGPKALKLRPAIMSGAINASNWDKVFKKEDSVKRTPKNVTYTDSSGNVQTQLIFMDDNGRTFDEKGTPIVLPTNAQLTITGRTPEDAATGVSTFTDSEAQAVRTDIINSRKRLRTLGPITEESIDKFLSLKGRGIAALGSGLSALTGLGGDTVNEAIKSTTGVDVVEFAGEQGVLFGDLENYFNSKRHDITGAAAAVAELKSLRKGLLSGDISPVKAKARLRKVIADEQAQIETNFELLASNGLDMPAYFDKVATPENTNSKLPAPLQEKAKRVMDILATIQDGED